jgi:hypothetical protein
MLHPLVTIEALPNGGWLVHTSRSGMGIAHHSILRKCWLVAALTATLDTLMPGRLPPRHTARALLLQLVPLRLLCGFIMLWFHIVTTSAVSSCAAHGYFPASTGSFLRDASSRAPRRRALGGRVGGVVARRHSGRPLSMRMILTKEIGACLVIKLMIA